jgi:hypothetical protein
VLTALGDPIVPALNDVLAAEDLPAEVRGAVADVLQRIGTSAAEQVLVEHLLGENPVVRLRVVMALNKLRQQNPGQRLERELIETVLAAEIMGHYRSYQILGQHLADGAAQAAADLQESMNAEIERIFRLMKLLFPGQDLHSAYVGLRSGNPGVHANALEFLEHTLPPQMRSVLLPLIDSEVSIADRVELADRMLGITVGVADQTTASVEGHELLRDVARQAESQLQKEESR